MILLPKATCQKGATPIFTVVGGNAPLSSSLPGSCRRVAQGTEAGKGGTGNITLQEEKYEQWLLSSRGDIHQRPAKKLFFISWPQSWERAGNKKIIIPESVGCSSNPCVSCLPVLGLGLV